MTGQAGVTQKDRTGLAKAFFLQRALSFLITLCLAVSASADELRLQDLIAEALEKSPEILASESRAKAAGYRVPQAGSLPDPMFMFGY